MALSNRSTSPLSLFKHSDQGEKENEIEEPEQITRPFKALARVEPTVEEPAVAQAETTGEPFVNPPLEDIATNTNVNLMPVVLPPEVPLYLRNPGPPPRLPRNQNVKSLGRTSYRFQEVKFGYSNRRALLYICAVIGIILLFVLIVLKPQDRKIEVSGAAVSASGTLGPVPTRKPSFTAVSSAEQFAIVTDVAGFVLEEPRDGAVQVQNLSQFTYIAFQKKSDNGWYQLKGGIGWIKASAVKVFETEKAAWDFKNSEEAKIKG